MEIIPGKSRAIVQRGEYLVWKDWDLLEDEDLLAFYDGPLSKVLEPDDPRLKAGTQSD